MKTSALLPGLAAGLSLTALPSPQAQIAGGQSNEKCPQPVRRWTLLDDRRDHAHLQKSRGLGEGLLYASAPSAPP